MCLIAFAIDCHPVYRLVLAANRDEFRSRKTEQACFWHDAPHVLAGRDQQAGGTWLGVTTSGKIAAVTNYRDGRQQVHNPPSRGSLVAGYLSDPAVTSAAMTKHLAKVGQQYDGFNLLYGSSYELHYFTNRGGSSGPVTPGIHALSNHLLDTRWPKVVTARQRLTHILQQHEISCETLVQAMSDSAPYADALLPDTGIGRDRERFLSPLFITGDIYCTRTTTVILIRYDGAVTVLEQGYDMPVKQQQWFTFNLEP